MRKLSTVEMVAELLRTYGDVCCPLNAVGEWIGRGPGSRFLDRPEKHDYHQGSYRELEQVLAWLRDVEPVLYDALSNEFMRERKIVEERVQRKAKNNRTVTVVERKSVPVRKSDPRHVQAGIACVAAEMDRLRLLVQLPREIYELASA